MGDIAPSTASGKWWGRVWQKCRWHVAGPLRASDLLVGAAFALLLTLLVTDFQLRTIPQYRLGDIATAAVKAPVEMAVPDEAATARKRTAAMEAVPGIFDLDSPVISAAETEIRNLFLQGRSLVGGDGTGRRPIAVSESRLLQVQSQLESRLIRPISRDLVRALLARGFDRELENQVVDLLRSAATPAVTDNPDTLLRFRSQGIVLRDVVTQEEKLVREVSAVRDARQARSELRKRELILQPMSESDRRSVIAYLDGLVAPYLTYNSAATSVARAEAARNVDTIVLQVKKGKTIIREGDEITATEMAELAQLRRFQDQRQTVERLSGGFIIASVLLLSLWRFLLYFQTRHRKIRNHFLLIAVLLAMALTVFRAFVALSTLVAESLNVESLTRPDLYYVAAPLGFGAILVVLLVDWELTVLYSVALASLAGLLTGDYGIVVFTLLGGFAAVLTLNHYRERAAIVKAGTVLALVNMLTIIALNLVRGTIVWNALTIQTLCAFLGGFMAAMIASLLLPPLEHLFGITTDIRLLELSNLNTPILRRLAAEAPGTYHHSIIVGALAEAAAEAIGANSLLVRVGAYYHDIGKVKRPEYYVENQAFSSNKHDSLSPSMSSLIIASHVRDGLEMADQIKLPQKIRDLIPQHHGTKMMTYFYQKARDAAEGTDRTVDESSFRYPGPKPQTREAAILMLADTVDAASRTLSDPAPAQVISMVKQIAYANFSDGQFDECDITMKDLDLIAHAFMRVLVGMHHRRIDYPGFDFNKVEKEKFSPEPNPRIQ